MPSPAGGLRHKFKSKAGRFYEKFVCDLCGYIYDEAAGAPDEGVAPGTLWVDVPDSFVCPLCGADKSQFSEA